MTFRRLFAGAALALTACYSAGDGTDPPDKNFYFPVGLSVSRGGNVLYVVNADFDLQWNGGTLQSYDLHLIRRHAAIFAGGDPTDPNAPPIEGIPSRNGCPGTAPTGGTVNKVGDTCAPPVDSTRYVRDSAIIGAFATDLQLSQNGSRLFVPVRGDATLTWADVAADDPNVAPPEDPALPYAPFAIDCGVRTSNRCDSSHHAGNNPQEQGNTRGLTMPGEPFGMAQSEDGTAIVVTHQTDTKTSLFSTGLDPSGQRLGSPALQFVVDGLVVGVNGITAIPHDKDAFPGGVGAPRPAFLQTSRNNPELALLRYYSDEGSTTPGSALQRPFLVKEAAFSLTANAGGSDSRGIIADPTPRIVCKSQVGPVDPSARPPRTQDDVDRDIAACARIPARVFFANRSPASMILGEVGEASTLADGSFDPDRLTIFGNVPLSAGPSRLYLAPIVDADGNYALRVFIVCFDSATIFVYDPEAGAVENIIRVGAGPFAITFDPFNLEDVALRRPVPRDAREPGLDLRRYRFAYVASFTNSFVQVLDLDNARVDKSTFETVVFQLGHPVPPKGSQ
jgi:hypothetical protein